MSAFLVSCAQVKCVDWHIFHDQPVELNPPKNVIFRLFSLDDFRFRIKESLGVNGSLVEPYKLTDFKPSYGVLFEDYIRQYDYFGWGDIDVVFGRVDHFLDASLGRWNVLSFSEGIPSNHFLLLRNTIQNRTLFQKIEGYRHLLQSAEHHAMDDVAFNRVLMSQPKVWSKELYATPHVNWRTWMDGTFNFPTKWKWNKGQLTNNLDVGYEFLYFHFMVLKGGYRDYYVRTRNWEGLSAPRLTVDAATEAFSITPRGLQSMVPARVSKLLRAGIDPAPYYSLRRRIRIKKLGLGL